MTSNLPVYTTASVPNQASSTDPTGPQGTTACPGPPWTTRAEKT